MSYLTTTKELLGEDLRNLISSVTKFERGSAEFARLEESAWRQIFQKYHVSVSDDRVKNSIDSLIEKFIFHGFPQKADNLRTLISYYTNLQYFKNKADGTLKWGLILLLIRLSYKPTEDKNDDPPIVLSGLLNGAIEKGPSFDWAAYLKEGWEKFRLPSDDGSEVCSDEEAAPSDDLREERCYPEGTPPFHHVRETSPELEMAPDLHEAFCKEKLNELNRWIGSQSETPWWRDSTFSDNITCKHPVSNFCRLWLENFKDQVVDVRIIEEYKIIQELLFVAGTVTGASSYLVDYRKGVYSMKKNISLSSLSPTAFHSFVDTEFCAYLPDIAKLIKFTSTVSGMNLRDPGISNTYIAYSRALSDILNNFRLELAEVEKFWKKKEGVITLPVIFQRLRVWFDSIRFISSVHTRGVYENFTQVESWRCSLRLLSVLMQQMKILSNSQKKKILLGIFLNAVSVYLKIIGCMIKGTKNADPKSEFVIYESADDNSVKIRRYEPVLWENSISPEGFWKDFITSCYKAISSTHFIAELGKRSSFSKLNLDGDVLVGDVIEGLRAYISPFTELVDVKETVEFTTPMYQMKVDSSIKLPKFSSTPNSDGCLLVREMFVEICKPKPYLLAHETPVDRFMKCLENCDLAHYPIDIFLPKVFISVINKYMEPVGFAYHALIEELKLLDHLGCLRRVYFLQILDPFVMTLFQKIVTTSFNHNWTTTLRDSILEHYDQKVALRFNCSVPQVSLIDKNHPKFIHNSLGLARIHYQPETSFKILIPPEFIKSYNAIFKFLLQVKWAHFIITKEFQLRGVLETPQNNYLYKRMYVLRMRLVNTMHCFRNYFFSMDEAEFEENIKKLCNEARDLQTIVMAHKDFLIKCKTHCFLKGGKECLILVEAILVMCFKCISLWRAREDMANRDLDALEEEYYLLMKNLVFHLNKKEQNSTGPPDRHFSLLLTELEAYVPRSPPSKFEVTTSDFATTFSFPHSLFRTKSVSRLADAWV